MILAILVAILCVSAVAGWIFVYQLMLMNGRILTRLKRLEGRLDNETDEDPLVTGLPVGTVLNDFELPAVGGGTRTLSSWRGRKLLLIFFSPHCRFCRALLPDLATLDPLDGRATLPIVISTGDVEENRLLFQAHRVRLPVLLQEDSELASMYRVNGTPMGYGVDEQGATETPLLTGAKALLDFVRASPSARSEGTSRALSRSRLKRDGLDAGTRAPEFALPLLTGGELRLDSYRGANVLLVFSDPGCGPCMALAPKLQALQARTKDLSVVMISRGDVDANQAKAGLYGLTFPIVLQRHWEVSRDYGMFATPIAYLIDRDGVLASEVAVGEEAILRLAGR